MAQNVSITLQNTDEGRAIAAAILSDNAAATVANMPSLTKIDCPWPAGNPPRQCGDAVGSRL